VLLARGRADLAAALLREDATGGRSPHGLLVRAVALRTNGRAGEASSIVNELVGTSPGYCEARALQIALGAETSSRAEALRRADALFEEASRPDAPRALYGCAAMTAAGLGDASRAAPWLRRIAADAEALRFWTSPSSIGSVNAAFRQRRYPWTKIADDPLLAEAKRELDGAFARMRAAIARVVQPLVTDKPSSASGQ
jgi:hypothetical protein